MRKVQLAMLASIIWCQCSIAQKELTSLVNPFIGTGGHGHCFPGASMPFGMMQLSPDTRLTGWDGCGGYHYSDSMIYGFSHTHLSGTGIADYCDVLLMPFAGEVKWKNKEYASHFSHQSEKASPGYYEVMLDKHHIKAALTTSIRAGMHEYSFDQSGEGKVLLDLQHRDQVLESSLDIINDHELKGMRRSKSWAKDQILYFYIRFEQPIKKYGIALDDLQQYGIKSATGKNIKSWFGFDLPADKKLRLKIGISGVSAANAKENLDKEIADFNFQQLRSKANTAWNKELNKIQITGGTRDQQISFYSALYHTFLSPNIYTDINGQYRGTDLKVHQADGFTNYSVFSLWDTHRAFNPLMTIINRKRTADWINTFLVQYKYGGMLPVWELSGNETFCMIGYHSVPVIVDAYRKGIRGFDAAYALKAMTEYAESNRFGLKAYRELGYVGNDNDNESASKTVEYAFDDWCIAQFAKWQGKDSIAQRYYIRAQQYKNLFDPSSKHIRGKVKGLWYSPFDATEVNHFFTEGNSWHYSFTAQQDLDGLIKLYGGRATAASKLEELFTTTQKLSGRDQSDVTGLIGQYAHGNEPSHHMAYLFNYVGKPWRTQELIHKICTEFYPNNPDGLIGNEDCGQMSAWFVMSAMGIYEVTPGSGDYAIGSPLFQHVKINLENGKTFEISAPNRTAANFYVGSVALNGKAHPASFIRHEDLENGGKLQLNMVAAPNRSFGAKENEMPHSSIDDSQFLTVPYFDMEHTKFEKTGNVVIKCPDSKATIYYQLNLRGKQQDWTKYTGAFEIDQPGVISCYAQKGNLKTAIIEQNFFKVPSGRSIQVLSKVNPMYTAGGPDALIDSIIGDLNWKNGGWQSYNGRDFEAIMDLSSIKPVHYVAVHVLQDVNSWIIYPSKAIFEISDDGKNFKPLASVNNTVEKKNWGPFVQQLGTDVNATGRYIRIKAINGGPVPAPHEGEGSPSHIFIDEVIVN